MCDETVAQLQPANNQSAAATRILAVDDDESQLASLEHSLRKQGYSVTTAGTAAQARIAAMQERIDLILLDLKLPDQEGFGLCSELADHPQTCGVPIIVISGLDAPDIVRQARAAGGSFYLRKPYDPSVVLALIEQALREETQIDW